MMPTLEELEAAARERGIAAADNPAWRELSEGQRAMIGARIVRFVFVPKNSNPHSHSRELGDLRQMIAYLLGVRPWNLKAADNVLNHGCPELVAGCESDAVGLSFGDKVAAMPQEQQPGRLAGYKRSPNKSHPRKKKPEPQPVPEPQPAPEPQSVAKQAKPAAVSLRPPRRTGPDAYALANVAIDAIARILPSDPEFHGALKYTLDWIEQRISDHPKS